MYVLICLFRLNVGLRILMYDCFGNYFMSINFLKVLVKMFCWNWNAHDILSLACFYVDSVKNMTWPWLTSCWMIRSWQRGNTESGSSWTLCWSRTCTSSSGLHLPSRASSRICGGYLQAALKILFDSMPGFSPINALSRQFFKRLQGLSSWNISFSSEDAI